MRRRTSLSVAFAARSRDRVGGDAWSGRRPRRWIRSRSDGFDVVRVSGFVDRIVADFLETSIERAERVDVGGLILQVNSTRSVLDDDD